MRIAIVLVVTALTLGAQPPGYLLDDFAKTAKVAIPAFSLSSNLRVAELTRLSYPAISRRFAGAAVDVKQGGMTYYYAMRLLAGMDFEAAIAAAAETNDPVFAYRAVTEQAIYNDDPETFLKLLTAANEGDAYGLESIYLALRHWGDDEIFVKDLTARLVNGLPEGLGPREAIYLFEALRFIGPETIDQALLRRAITVVEKAVLQPEFDLPELRQSTDFRIHGELITTRSLAEAAFLRALAFGAALDEKEFLEPVIGKITWAHLLKALQLEDLRRALDPIHYPNNPQPRSLEVEVKVAQLLDVSRRPGLDREDYARLIKDFCEVLDTVDDVERYRGVILFYDASLAWPKYPEQDEATRLYIGEIERLAEMDSPYAARMREMGDLTDRLDAVAARLGRVPSKWPVRLNSWSVLLRHYVYEIEQATLNGTIDASITIVGGSDITLRDLRGRVVVIVFWRTDCRACQAWRQEINRLNKPIGKSGLWAIAVSDEPEDVVLGSLDRNPFWASIAIDESWRVAHSFAVNGRVPAAVVIDRAGHLVARLMRPSVEEMRRAIESAGVHLAR